MRTEVVHQVNNSYFSEACQSIRMKEMKLIVGNPGDARTIAWPELAETEVRLTLVTVQGHCSSSCMLSRSRLVYLRGCLSLAPIMLMLAVRLVHVTPEGMPWHSYTVAHFCRLSTPALKY